MIETAGKWSSSSGHEKREMACDEGRAQRIGCADLVSGKEMDGGGWAEIAIVGLQTV